MGDHAVSRIGESTLKALVYVFAWLSWAVCMLLIVMLVDVLLKGHFEEYWLPVVLIIFGAAALMANVSRDFIKHGLQKVVSLFHPTRSDDTDKRNAAITAREPTAMSGNGKLVINNPASVTINQNTTHNNVQGGIIGNGTVHVHHHVEGRPAETITPIRESAEAYPAAEASPSPVSLSENEAVAVSGHVREGRREFRKKWSDLVRIAEMLFARPNEEITAKELWAALRPGESCDDNARAYISTCVAAIRDMLAAEHTGWQIPKGRYIVRSVSENTTHDADGLANFLAQLKNAGNLM